MKGLKLYTEAVKVCWGTPIEDTRNTTTYELYAGAHTITLNYTKTKVFI